jgi:redox-sensitive bicupin YhaK (pirin superfamily)
MVRTLSRVIPGMPASDGAGVRLSRLIGQPGLDQVDPFLLFDEFRSDDPNDYGAGFPTHPHRGFETVTYMIEGRMRHKDNQGNEGLLGPGDIQWMTAGKGLFHSEMPEQVHGRMHGFQLWLNLPAKDKLVPPRYQDIPAASVPEIKGDGSLIRVLAGTVDGVTGPVEGGFVQPFYVDVTLSPGHDVVLPLESGSKGFVYPFEGSVEVGTVSVGEGHLGILEGDGDLHMTSKTGSRILVIAARPLNEPVARHGPFVMNTPEEIIQAFRDARSGEFGPLPSME